MSKEHPLQHGYIGKCLDNGRSPTNRLMVGIPMTGLLRAEWVLSRYGQVIPCNWSTSDCVMWLDQYSPLRYSVADARNLIVDQAIKGDFEWLLFIDHDVILPPKALIKFNDYMLAGDTPIVNGLYFTKSVPAEPLIYKGRGNSYFKDWHLGDKVWVDGAGMGCTLINGKVLKAFAEDCEEYQCKGMTIKKVFVTPYGQWFDPEKAGWESTSGTEDLHWYTRIISGNYLAEAGFEKFRDDPHPILVDTSIYCTHIDFSGIQYPTRGEHEQFMREEDKAKFQGGQE